MEISYSPKMVERGLARLAAIVCLLILASAGTIFAAEVSSKNNAEVREYFKQFPKSDLDGDGTLTLSEVYKFSKRFNKKPQSPEALAAATLFEETFKPVPVAPDESFGPAPGKKIQLFILSGQSNMVGQGLSAELPEEMKRGNGRVLMFEEGRWQPLRPLKRTFGPEITFAHAMAKAWPGETIGIVKQSVGGTGILAWHPQWTVEKADLTRDGHKGNLWKALTGKVRQARESAECEPTAFVWLQGGKDMHTVETGKQYLENLRALVEGLRGETGAADLPLILGSYRGEAVPDDLSDIDPASVDVQGRPGAPYVLKAQFDAQKALAPAKMVPLRNLSKHFEDVHYDTDGQMLLGRLFAKGFLTPRSEKTETGNTRAGKPNAQNDPDSDSVYLYSFFRDPDGADGLRLAYSKDFFNWTEFERSFFQPSIGNTTKKMNHDHKVFRDPFVTPDPEGGFRMVWTTGWDRRDIGCAYSPDLVHWSGETLIPVMRDRPALNCWAPKLFCDEGSQTWFILWSTTLDDDTFPENSKHGHVFRAPRKTVENILARMKSN